MLRICNLVFLQVCVCHYVCYWYDLFERIGETIFFSYSSKQELDPIFAFSQIFKPSKKFRFPQFKKAKVWKNTQFITSSLHATSADHSAAYRLSSNHMMMDHDIPSSNIECANWIWSHNKFSLDLCTLDKPNIQRVILSNLQRFPQLLRLLKISQDCMSTKVPQI